MASAGCSGSALMSSIAALEGRHDVRVRLLVEADVRVADLHEERLARRRARLGGCREQVERGEYPAYDSVKSVPAPPKARHFVGAPRRVVGRSIRVTSSPVRLVRGRGDSKAARRLFPRSQSVRGVARAHALYKTHERVELVPAGV